MQKNVTGQFLTVYVWDSTTGLPKTGDAANLTAYRAIDGGTVTVLADTSAAEKDSTNAKGYYQFDLSQAETNGDVILFSCKSSTANMVCRCVPDVVQTVPANFSILDINATGGAGIDWANVQNPTTALNLSGTNIDVDQVVASVSGTVAGVTPATTAGILTTALTEAYAADSTNATLTQLLYMIWAFLSEAAISGTTKTSKKLDGSTTAMTHTLNSATQPTSITRAT